MATGDKIVNLDDLKVAYDALNASKLDKNFSSLDTSGGFSLSDTIPVNISGTTYKITGQTLSNAIGGGGGTQQASLTNYVKNCGTISVLPVTLTDSNITSDMIVIEYTVGDETALGSDWTVTTADGSLTISGTLNKSTTLQLVLSVGYSTTPSILTNLASDSADNVLKASPRPGVTGVLPLTHGGVGSSTASGARTNLSVYSKAETDSAISQSTAACLTSADVIDNLTSTSTTAPLSAAQGKVVGDRTKMYGNIPSGTNLDTLTDPNKCGYLLMSGTYTNHPNPGVQTQLFVINQSNSGTTYYTQIAISSDLIFVRRKFPSSGEAWTIWQTVQMGSCGWQSSGTNIDNMIRPGTYGFSSSNTYSGTFPSGVSSGILEVISPSNLGTYCYQKLYGVGVMYTRYRSGSNGTAWSGWYKFTGTQA